MSNWWEGAPLVAGRIAGQFGQKATDALLDAAAIPLDASAWLSRQFGLVPSDTARPSAALKHGVDQVLTVPGRIADAVDRGSITPLYSAGRTTRFEPGTRAERWAGDVGSAVGDVISTVVPAARIARAAEPVIDGLGRVLRNEPSLIRHVAQSAADQPGLQLLANSAGNVVTGETGNPWIGMAASMGAGQAGFRAKHAAPAKTDTESERRALLVDAQRNGIPVPFDKILDNEAARATQGTLARLPFVGGRQAALDEAGRTAFNRAVFDRAPMLKGQGHDAATPGTLDSGIARARSRLDEIKKEASLAGGAGERTMSPDRIQDSTDAQRTLDVLSMLKGAMSKQPSALTAVGHVPPAAMASLAANEPELERLARMGTRFVSDKVRSNADSARDVAAATAAFVGMPSLEATMLMGGGALANALLNNPYTQKALIGRYANAAPLDRNLAATVAGQQVMRGQYRDR